SAKRWSERLGLFKSVVCVPNACAKQLLRRRLAMLRFTLRHAAADDSSASCAGFAETSERRA
ncbi:unnamed protein product, partial [Ixodes pacificus]